MHFNRYTNLQNHCDQRRPAKQHLVLNHQLIQRFIRKIFQFERTYQVSRESSQIFHQVSQVFMRDQILRMQEKKRPQITFPHDFQSLAISQKFKVRHLITSSALKTFLVNRLVPTGKERDPTQANNRLLELVHFYASSRQ